MASDMPLSLVYGTDPEHRALFWNILAANGVPTTANQGVGVGMSARVDVVLSETAGGTFKANIWWWYSDAGLWVQDLAIGSISVAANSTAGTITTPSAASRLYVEALTFAGGAEASGWAIGRLSLGRHS